MHGEPPPPKYDAMTRDLGGKLFTSRQGAKQHGHKIARTDAFPTARLSITAVTSSWSDGSAGPLGLCVPQGMVKQDVMDSFNAAHRGHAFMFSSLHKGHFMNGATFITLMKGMLSDAFALQRQRYQLASSVKGLILCDAWTGFHCHRSGLDCSREAWAEANSVVLPDKQVGGWSANGQPVDQLHHLLRYRMDLVDCSDVGWSADLRQRPVFDAMPVRPNGQPARPKALNANLPERTLRAWQSVCLA